MTAASLQREGQAAAPGAGRFRVTRVRGMIVTRDGGGLAHAGVTR